MEKKTQMERSKNKYAIEAYMERCAREGRVVAYRDLAEHLGDGGRRELVGILDKINEKTCRTEGILLSIVVVGENGMPDSGFFDKFRAGEKRWPLERWEGRSRDKDSRAIFREELAAVYDRYGAPEKVHVFIDLENAPNGWKKALCWLCDKKINNEPRYSLSGVACTKKKDKMADDARRFLKEFDGIDFRRVPKVGPKGQEADAAILVEFGRATHLVTTRDLVCFIAVADRIYKPATEIALRDGMKVLRFCSGEALKWTPKSEGFYRRFDINGSAEDWDAVLDASVGD